MPDVLRVAVLCLLAAQAGAVELTSIDVTPTQAFVVENGTQLFSATGTFSDATTGRLSNATLAAGGNHTCAVSRDGTLRCWGQNGAGQLGSSGPNAFVPVRVPIGLVTAVAGGFQHSCAVQNGAVQCWGRGTEGQLGNGAGTNSAVPVLVSGLGGTAIAVGAGFQHSCALLSDGGVRCWGKNGDGQLGSGLLGDSTTPVSVFGLGNAVALSVGGNNSCALLATGGVKCWGANNSGQLGNGGGGSARTPVPVSGITSAFSIASGFDYNCALLASGGVQCWGRGLEGQLGNGGKVNSPLPVDVTLPGRAVALSAATTHTCALVEGGSLYCWGNNGNGQLGIGTVIGTFATPVAVSGSDGAIAVTTGFAHTCAMLQNGVVRCWGLNDSGQLGNGSSVQRSGSPVNVNGTAARVDTGGNHSCAIGKSGSVTCWGYNEFGQLGQSAGDPTPPVVVSGIVDAVDIALGFDHSCALLANGSAQCWGRNNFGQLGIDNPGLTQTSTPFPVSGLHPASAIAAGAYHTCAIVDGGAVQCWGENNAGQLANPNGTGSSVYAPITVPGISNAIAITGGFEHTCALLANHTVLCWGRNDEGELGNGGNGNTNSPVAVVGISTATAISAGNFHTCARLSSSQIQCWGRNDEGQLGNILLTGDSSVPVDTDNDGNALDVTAGGFHSCLLAAGGFVRCWGRGDLGQIGSGQFMNRTDAQTVSGINTAIAVDAGRSHTCAILSDGSMRCWGYDEFGQLGDGGSANSALPVLTQGLNMEGVALDWSVDDSGSLAAKSGFVHAASEPLVRVTASYGPVQGSARLDLADDTDGDTVVDPYDNCIFFANPDQLDVDANGIGNLCECGDQNGDGRVDVLDLIAIHLAIFNPALATPLCDANDDQRCDVVDIVRANAKIFGVPAYCSRYPSPR